MGAWRAAWIAFLAVAAGVARPAAAAPVHVIRVDGIITPSTAGYISDAIKQADREAAEALVIELDTPGGLDTSMRDVIKDMLAAERPIVVYVSPSGGRAASAGCYITLAAHVAAMAPATNIGAATPVAMGGEMGKDLRDKAINDAAAYIRTIAERRGRNVKWAEDTVRKKASATEKEALQLKVIDLVSPRLETLLEAIDGRTVETAKGKVTLRTKGAAIKRGDMTFRDKILKIISDPTIAYILLMLGLLGLYFEFSTPGAILPGVLGGIFLILAFYAFQTLPINYAGLLLIILAAILFLAEIKVQSHGILTIGGITALILGSLMLVDSPAPFMRVSLSAILSMAAVTTAFFLFVVGFGVRALRGPTTTGAEGLVGTIGTARARLAPEGQVLVRGELWTARCDEPVEPGEPVRVERVEGLRLTVSRLRQETPTAPRQATV
jgi:membrane-bound serine protease (ClpP class)